MRGSRGGLTLLSVALMVAALPPPAAAWEAPGRAGGSALRTAAGGAAHPGRGAGGHPRPGPATVGFTSTLPGYEPLAARVLSLPAGGSTPGASRGRGSRGPTRSSGCALPTPTPISAGCRRPACWPGAGWRLRGCSPSAGPATPAGPLDRRGRIALRPGSLLVAAVPHADALRDVLGRLVVASDAGPLMVAGLRPAPGRAHAAPLLLGAGPGADGQRLHPPLGPGRLPGHPADPHRRPVRRDNGTVIRVASDPDPAGTATWLDRRAGALVTAHSLAIPLLALVALLALLVPPAAWWASRRGGSARWEGAVLVLLALTLALPPGHLASSMAEPPAARLARVLFQGLLRAPGTARLGARLAAAGLAAAVALAVVALWLDRRPPVGRAGPGRLPAPALLGGVLLALVAADLLRGGDGLAQPLVGGSA